MGDTSPASDLDGLLDLASRTGVDIMPTLLRVLTDLFVQRRIRSTDAAKQYILIATRLLDRADLETRKAVASKLAVDPLAPLVLIKRLASDDIAVAEPVLRHSTRLSPLDLAAIAQSKGGDHAKVIAERMPLATDDAVDRSATDAAMELATSFFSAGSEERRLILISLDYAAYPDEPPRVRPETIDRLEAAALKADTRGLALELERALRISSAQARRVVDDPSGEALVAAAKALECPAAVFQRIVLFANPAIGQSIDRVYELSELYGEISAYAARQLVSIWRDSDPATPRPQHAAHAFEPATVRQTQTQPARNRLSAQPGPRRLMAGR